MRAGLGVLDKMKVGIAAALSLGACDRATSETPALPEGLELPIFEAGETDADIENLSVAVSATDAAGLSAGQRGFAGPSRSGECRIHFNNISPVTSDELYDQAFARLDAVVESEGGIEALIANPDRIPVAHIWGDINAPWRCIAGAIYNVQIAGYPTVGFIFTPIDTAPPTVTRAAYFDLPVPVSEGASEVTASVQKITLTAVGEILWNGVSIDQQTLSANLRALKKRLAAPDSELESVPVDGVAELDFEVEPDVSYDFAAKVLGFIAASEVSRIRFVGIEEHRSFAKAPSAPTSRP